MVPLFLEERTIMIKDALMRLIDDNDKEVKRLRRKVEAINRLEADFTALPAEEFPRKTA